MLEYLFIAFIAIFCIQFIYYIFIFGAFAFSKKQTITPTFQAPVSVLICAKNEAKNLKKNIPFYLNQSYANYELVLINDCSRDKTLEIFEQFKQENPQKIKIVNVKENEQFWGSKKYALTLGIKAASHEHLLFTDADCKPVSEHWIQEMVQQFATKNIILGYGAYTTVKKSFLNKIIRFETLLTAIQYFSYAKIGLPYMGVGRNLAYTKSLFFSVNGFADHIKITSGDDDLFINQVATKQNTACCYSANSITLSKPKTTFKQWIHQKRRHIATANYYKPKHKILLGLFYCSQLLFWLLSFLLLLFLYQWIVVAALIFTRFVIQNLVIGFSAKKLNERKLVVLTPLLEIFLIFVQFYIFIKNSFSKPRYW